VGFAQLRTIQSKSAAIALVVDTEDVGPLPSSTVLEELENDGAVLGLGRSEEGVAVCLGCEAPPFKELKFILYFNFF
jgi:hypothetical protein